MTSARKASESTSTQPVSQRAKVVWASLAASLTAVTALLMAIDDSSRARMDGRALRPLARSSTSTSIESVFQTRQPVQPGQWRAIVVDHSGSRYGTPGSIDQSHRQAGLRGLGHHFVIGNGNGMRDGEIHVGERWLEQRTGAHTAGTQSDELNRHGIGICLVGDGQRREFTEAQLKSLLDLISALSGEYEIAPSRVVLHSEVAPATGPGRYFPAAEFYEQVDFMR